jgi:hypothetical protein
LIAAGFSGKTGESLGKGGKYGRTGKRDFKGIVQDGFDRRGKGEAVTRGGL